ncbi:MAG: hypothetical protein H7Y43_05405, partial [Akkermansiaceae bacterium]|nr:hypothetical protein [Verrucomicrobiales bacterium]
MAHRKRRLILRIFTALVLLLLALVAALPLWFPWVLRPVAKSLGLVYAAYERDGYSRFQLTDAVMATGGGIFRAQHIEAFIPTVWFWKTSINRQTNQPFLEVSAWEFQVQSRPSTTRAKPASSVYTNVMALNQTFATLRTWVPNATLTNGSVQLATNRAITISAARWLNGTLTAETVLPGNHPVELLATTRKGGAIELHAAAEALSLSSDLIATNTAAGMRLSGEMFWLTNRIQLSAEFGRSGSLPETASLRAGHFEIPGDAVKLANYRNVTGSLQAEWGGAETSGNGNFKLDLKATAVPLAVDLPPIEISLQASGDTNAARIDTAKVTLPWLHAELSEGTAIQFSPPFLSEPARLTVSADLAKQSRFPAAGSLQGTARLFPGTNRYPRITFTLNGDGISVSNIHTRSLEFTGELDWPLATISTSRITLTDGSQAGLTGLLNLASNTVERGEATVSGTFGRDFLPRGYSFETISVQAEVSGPFQTLAHSGKLELMQLRVPNWNPMQVNAEWIGNGADIHRAEVRLAASNAVLQASAALAGNATSRELTLSNLSLHTSRRGDMALERPV